MLPACDLVVESVSGTGSVHHLPVALQGEVGLQSSSTHSVGRQLIPHQPHCMLGGQPAGVISDEGDPESDRVVTQSVGPSLQPASALVDVPVRASHKTLEQDSKVLLSYAQSYSVEMEMKFF